MLGPGLLHCIHAKATPPTDGYQPMTKVGRDTKADRALGDAGLFRFGFDDSLMALLNLSETTVLPSSLLPLEGSDLLCGLMVLQGSLAPFLFSL